MNKLKLLGTLAVLTVFLSGCGKSVNRIEPESVIDLSGRWNDTDSKIVAEALIDQCLNNNWYKVFNKKHGKNPAIIVGTISNKTFEHIKTETFIKDLEKAIINSEDIDIVASKTERQEIREERTDMQKWASIKTRKTFGKETGADYMLKGVLNSIIDEKKGKKIVYYQVDINLIHLENNTIVWMGQKKIKKFIKKPVFKF